MPPYCSTDVLVGRACITGHASQGVHHVCATPSMPPWFYVRKLIYLFWFPACDLVACPAHWTVGRSPSTHSQRPSTHPQLHSHPSTHPQLHSHPFNHATPRPLTRPCNVIILSYPTWFFFHATHTSRLTPCSIQMRKRCTRCNKAVKQYLLLRSFITPGHVIE